MQPSTSATIAILLVAVAAIAAATGCDRDETSAAPSTQPGQVAGSAAAGPISIRVVPVAASSIDEIAPNIVGTLYGEQEAQIASKSTGRIVEVFADLGDRLAPGQPLAQVDQTDYQLEARRRELALEEALAKLGLTSIPQQTFDVNSIATVRRADVQAQNAKARLDRATQLFEQRPPLISEQEYADIQTQHDVARQDADVARLEAGTSLAAVQSRAAELAEAKQQLADTTLRTPGVGDTEAASSRWAVADRRISIGEFVQPGTVTYRVIADQPMLFRADVPERFLGRVRQGQAVSLAVASRAERIAGKVSRVSPAVDAASRTFKIEVTFPNKDRALNAGSFGRSDIVIGQRDNVLIVPTAALYSFAGLDKVFTVAEGKAVAHNVRVIERRNDEVVIENTLKGATHVSIDSLSRLATGVPVTAREEPATVAASRGGRS